MNALATLGHLEAHRLASLPARASKAPLRSTVLEAFQQRNTMLDAIFYDVDIITPDETSDLASSVAREGAVILVPPSRAEPLEVFDTAEGFLDRKIEVGALTVAGVGSTALGAAAFGRNVANAIGEPVAAVVSGYGLADLAAEALGGFFWFGALNSLRHLFEPLEAVSKVFGLTERSFEISEGVGWTRTSGDTESVIALLESKRFTARLLVGHSKGNLVISEALYAISNEREATFKDLAERCNIVTISAKIGMPGACREVFDIMGQWDLFGLVNSRPDLRSDHTVPHALHSTNPDFPMGLGIDVTEVLKEVIPELGRHRPTGPEEGILAILDLPQELAMALRQPQR